MPRFDLKILKICKNCYSFQVEDPNGDQYWTEDPSAKELAEKKKEKIKTGVCPNCGGNKKELTGNFYCRQFMLENAPINE